MPGMRGKLRGLGAFAPLSSRYYLDGKIVEVSLPAELLYVRAMAFCSGELNDGEFSARQMFRSIAVGFEEWIGPLGLTVQQLADELVDVGLWVRTDAGGLRVVAWLRWNNSRDEVDDYRARERARKARTSPDQGEPAAGDGSARRSARKDPLPRGRRTGADAGPGESDTTGSDAKHIADQQQQPFRAEDPPLPRGTDPASARNDDPFRRISGTRARYPDPDPDRESPSDSHTTARDDEPGGGVLALVPPPALPAERAPADPPGFDAFWSECPRKTGKGKARTEYAKVVRRGVAPEQLRQKMAAHANTHRIARTEQRYIPHPATWLSQGRWEDEDAAPAAPRGTTAERVAMGGDALAEFRRRHGNRNLL